MAAPGIRLRPGEVERTGGARGQAKSRPLQAPDVTLYRRPVPSLHTVIYTATLHHFCVHRPSVPSLPHLPFTMSRITRRVMAWAPFMVCQSHGHSGAGLRRSFETGCALPVRASLRCAARAVALHAIAGHQRPVCVRGKRLRTDEVLQGVHRGPICGGQWTGPALGGGRHRVPERSPQPRADGSGICAGPHHAQPRPHPLRRFGLEGQPQQHPHRGDLAGPRGN